MKNKERISDKKGISLIVLVITIIVIIILAVAVILSIANNNPIENAKEARFKNDVKAMQEELELLKSSNYAKNNGTDYGEIALTDLNSSTNYTGDFEVKDGELYIKSDNKLTENEKKWANELGVEKAPITFDRVDKTKALAIGSEVEASNREPFYIIGGDEVGKEVTDSTKDIILLAKYNLKSDESSQDTSGEINPCAFSSENYWDPTGILSYPDENGKYLDLNDVDKYPIGSATSVITKAQKYGKNLFGVTGKLMTCEEAKELQTNYSEILYGKYAAKNGYLNYWLGSAGSDYSEDYAWFVYGWSSSWTCDNYFTHGSDCGVRPVIKVSKSLIK